MEGVEVDPPSHQLYRVDRPAPEEDLGCGVAEDGGDDEGWNPAVAAGHLRDHHDAGERRPGSACEEGGHPQKAVVRGVSQSSRKGSRGQDRGTRQKVVEEEVMDDDD